MRVDGLYLIENERGSMASTYGYLYMEAPPSNAAAVQREWKVLVAMAEKPGVVVFKNGWSKLCRIRSLPEPVAEPDTYHPGMMEVIEGPLDPLSTAGALLRMPIPMAPTGLTSCDGNVTMVARAARRTELPLVFELMDMDLPQTKERSSPIRAADGEARWVPNTALAPGRKYLWRAWTVDAGGIPSPSVPLAFSIAAP
jgi:hypothetical protein